ncbi:nitrogen fixation protein NifS [Salmonella enterica]|nr:nitrogen fixation protein NifS [Salmonella enterica]EGF9691596.1 nitrogen fixation protein NifS [Salmonella enterica]EJK8997419.1 nitrogen fixation protein NifS [Salmonella enterica]
MAGIGGGLFAYYREAKYLAALNYQLAISNIDWFAECDDTESDIEKLISQDASILICAPGLRFQFYRNGFNKRNIIYLSTMEYMNNDVRSVIKRINEIESGK